MLKTGLLATVYSVFLYLATLPASVNAAVLDAHVELIVIRDQLVPGLNDTFRDFGAPVLNNNEVAALPFTTFSGDQGIIRGTSSGVNVIAVSGQAVPGGNGVYDYFSQIDSDNPGAAYVALTDSGLVLFNAKLTGTAGGDADDAGLFISDGATTRDVVRKGQPAPDVGGGFNGTISSPFEDVRLNQNGQVAFISSVDSASGGYDKYGNVFVENGSSLISVHRVYTADSDNWVSGPRDIAFSDSGQVAFSHSLKQNASFFDRIVVGDGVGVEVVATASSPIPGGGVTFGSFSNAEGRQVINNQGEVAFTSTLHGTSGSEGNSGLFLYDGLGVDEIVREGVEVPGDVQSAPIAMNDAGQVAGVVAGTTTAAAGLYRVSASEVALIAAAGQNAPDGNGQLGTFGTSIAINATGQMAFIADMVNASAGASEAIFFYDDGVGLVQAVRRGDEYLGATITSLQFAADNIGGEEATGFNNQGQIAFKFSLDDGRSGIGIWSAAADPGILGDLDGDGFVGIADLNIVLAVWNQNVPPANSQADPSGDGFVGIEDLNAVLGNWNAGAPPASGAIPEPGSVGLLVVGSVALLQRRSGA